MLTHTNTHSSWTKPSCLFTSVSCFTSLPIYLNIKHLNIDPFILICTHIIKFIGFYKPVLTCFSKGNIESNHRESKKNRVFLWSLGKEVWRHWWVCGDDTERLCLGSILLDSLLRMLLMCFKVAVSLGSSNKADSFG